MNCRPISCERLPDTFAHGHYDSKGLKASFPYKHEITVVCDIGYYLTETAKRRCIEPNTWSEKDPECLRVTCWKPYRFFNGQYNLNQTRYDFGSVLVPTCYTGYYISNNIEKRVCEQNGRLGSWSGTDPECRRFACRSPTSFSNGQYNPSQTSYDFGSVLVPTCHTGYYMSTNVEKRVCEGADTWSGSEPVCEIVKCETPTVLNGHFNSSTSRTKSYRYRDSISIQCDQGYELKGEWAARTCQADGTWNQPPLECVKLLCNDPSDIRHAAITLNNAYPTLAFGQSGNVTFNSTFFFLLHGSLEVTCTEKK